jgi:class 3 adenylate cyclase/tetratricopeptide (TPR) repeat protein
MNKNISAWLDELGLSQYANVFESNDISLAVLPALTENDLAGLGVSLGHRKLILQAAQHINASQPSVETVTAEGERRQVTVLYCDLVGSTALSNSLDPEVYRTLLSRYHETAIAAIQRFDGYVQQIQGDGVVAYFGYPIAHEQDADRAIRAGLSIVDTLAKLDVDPKLQVRIGIASGLVVVSHILAENKTAVGETPNLAQRMQTVANANEIIVSQRTRALAGGSFEFDDHGIHDLKGITAPTQVWRVTGASPLQTRFEAATRAGATPLVGRDQELGLLIDRWQSSRNGQGQVMLLNGEPGIGKSRMLRAFREQVGKDIQAVLSYQCSPYYNNTALYPIIDHLERTFNFERDDSAEAKLDKLEARLIAQLHCPKADCNFIARAMSIPCDERYGALHMTPQRQKDETLRALVDTVAAIAQQHATVMLMEDVHWVDPTSIEVLDQLIERAKGLPLLILITHRPEFESHWNAQPHVTEIPLTRLSRAQSATLILKVTNDKPLPADLVTQIVDKTDGVPLFLEELTKAVLESNIVKESGDRYEYSGKVDQMAIPATLRDSLMARLDRLFPVKELAQIGAVIGREFSHELLQAVSPIKEPKLTEGLDRLVASELIFKRGSAPSATYIFKHALVQDTAYESLLTNKRKELHEKIAETIQQHFPNQAELEPELVAQHYTKAEKTEQAIPLWLKAGKAALQRVALNESIAHLDTGLELNTTLPAGIKRDGQELELRMALATAWMMARGWTNTNVPKNLEPALVLARSLKQPTAVFLSRTILHVHLQTGGRIADALQLATETLAEADTTGDVLLRLAGHAGSMMSQFFLGNLRAACEQELLLRAAYRDDQHAWIVNLLQHDLPTSIGIFAAHWTWMLGYPDQAAKISDEKNELARRIGHPFNLGFALGFGSWVYNYRREPDKLAQHTAEGEIVARESGLVFLAEVQVRFTEALRLIDTNEHSACVEILGRYFASPMRIPVVQPYLLAVQAKSLATLGRYSDALSNIVKAIEQIERPGWNERCHYAEILRIKGWILQQQGEYKDAEFNLRASIDFARKQQAKSWELRTSTTLAEILAERGDRQQAIELLAPVYNWFTEGFDTYDLKQAKKLLDQLA